MSPDTYLPNCLLRGWECHCPRRPLISPFDATDEQAQIEQIVAGREQRLEEKRAKSSTKAAGKGAEQPNYNPDAEKQLAEAQVCQDGRAAPSAR